MIALLFAFFDSRPWPGVPVHPMTLADVLASASRRPEDARVAAEVGR